MEEQDDSYNIEKWYGESMELRCLLKCMTSTELIPDRRIMVEQISRAKILLNKIRLRLDDVLVDIESNQMREDATALLDSIEMSTNSAIQHVSEKLEHSENRDDVSSGLLSYIFSQDIESDDELVEDVVCEESPNPGNDLGSEIESSISKTIASITKPNLTTEELQRQQEEVLEEEISQMARQLKTSSLAIKATLAHQNQQLEEIETITQANLDKTKDITDKVTEEVKRGWRKTASRWFIFIIILGTWMFCFLTIRVVPKRKNACLFFCGTDGRKKEDGYEQSKTYDARGQRSNIIQDVLPKYSFCTEKGRECTRPMDPGTHIKNMEKMSDESGEDVAFDLANQLRLNREQDYLIKAQQEKDEVASKRVQEGWNSVHEEDEEEDYSNEDGRHDEDLDDDDDDHNDDEEEEDEEEEGDMLSQVGNKPDHHFQEDRDGASYTVQEMLRATVDNHYLTLRRILQKYPEWATIKDENGWQPIHEAAYRGRLDTLRILIEEFGADVNARTGIDHKNGSVLWWVLQNSESNNPIITYLTEMGATSIPPDDRIDSDERSEL